MEPTRSPAHLRAVRPQGPQASVLLGVGHPLARADERAALVRRQALVVVVLAVAALGALADGIVWAAALVAGATATLAALGAIAAGLCWSRGIEARALIAAGGERVPLRVVERERERLLSARTRRRLAVCLEQLLLEAAQRSPRAPFPVPLFDRAVVRAVAPELGAVAARLRTPLTEARGIAVLEALTRSGGSALYGLRVAPLREELRRVQLLLDAAPAGEPDGERQDVRRGGRGGS